MNQYEKSEVVSLQNEGLGYKRIADILGLPVNTVKSYCYRNKSKSTQITNQCKQCGIEVKQEPQRKQKQFCSTDCRMKWWNTHTEQITHKTVTKFICPLCGCKFEVYGKRTRKFCSRECYAKFRTKERK